MDTKLTLSFDAEVVKKAKEYAAERNISLSRLIEYLLTQVTSSSYQTIADYPISDWVSMVAEGEPTYKRTEKGERKAAKKEYFDSKK